MAALPSRPLLAAAPQRRLRAGVPGRQGPGPAATPPFFQSRQPHEEHREHQLHACPFPGCRARSYRELCHHFVVTRPLRVRFHLTRQRRRVHVMTTIPETHRDLLNAQVAVLGTIGASGRPQLSAIWFLAEGDTVKLSLNTARQKVKNLQANPACSLLILDPGNPYRTVELRGDAQIAPDPDYEFAKKVGAKYGGADLSEHDGPGEVRMVVTLVPKRGVVWGGAA